MKTHDFSGGFDTAAAGSAVRQMLPDGVHNATIREATEGPHKFDKPGDFLHLTLAPNGPYGLVWASFGTSDKDSAVVATLAQALGVAAEEWIDTDPADIVGREVRIRTKQVQVAGTKVRVFVNEFLPLEVPVAGTRPGGAKPRTAAAAVAKARGDEAGGEDDVPF